MGSPGRNLNVPEFLRAWHECGLTHVLVPGGAIALSAAGQGAPHPSAHGDAPASRSGAESRPDSPGPAGGAQSARAPVSREKAAPANVSARDDQPAIERSAKSGDDYRSWAEPWRSLWLKTPHEPRIVWTYFDLGAHMNGRPDPDASGFLKWLIGYFRWPKGTIAFWPMSQLGEQGLQPAPDMFWRGIDLLSCSQVAVFGADVLPEIAPQAPPDVRAVRVGDVMVHVLPSIAEMSPMLPHERLLALQSLRQLSF